jgi:uncharacterized membrane protein
MRPVQYSFGLIWLLMLLASVFLSGITLGYYSFCTDCNFLLRKQELISNPFWMTAFYIHISGGLLALLTGPWQFIPRFRRRYLSLHRVLGKIYVAGILFVAGPSGLFMAFYAEGGWVGMLGFTLMASLWLWSTFMAYDTIRNRDVMAHRDWMTRSFALTFAAVTLRAWVFGSTQFLHFDAAWVEASSAWISWIPNLIVAEILLRFFSKNI